MYLPIFYNNCNFLSTLLILINGTRLFIYFWKAKKIVLINNTTTETNLFILPTFCLRYLLWKEGVISFKIVLSWFCNESVEMSFSFHIDPNFVVIYSTPNWSKSILMSHIFLTISTGKLFLISHFNPPRGMVLTENSKQCDKI